MNIQKFIEVYEKDVEELKVIAEENKGAVTENATSIILVKQQGLVTSLKILQKDMLEWVEMQCVADGDYGEYNNETIVDKDALVEAFGLEKP